MFDGSVLIKRVRAGTECAIIRDGQCWFRQVRGCMDQMFAVSQVCEKYPANGKDVFCAFIDRHGMWHMLRVHRVGRKLLKALQSFFVDSRECVPVRMDVSEHFPVNVGLRNGCVMSPWLFNELRDGVVREVNGMVLTKGLELLSVNGGRFEINRLLFADDTPLCC